MRAIPFLIIYRQKTGKLKCLLTIYQKNSLFKQSANLFLMTDRHAGIISAELYPLVFFMLFQPPNFYL